MGFFVQLFVYLFVWLLSLTLTGNFLLSSTYTFFSFAIFFCSFSQRAVGGTRNFIKNFKFCWFLYKVTKKMLNRTLNIFASKDFSNKLTLSWPHDIGWQRRKTYQKKLFRIQLTTKVNPSLLKCQKFNSAQFCRVNFDCPAFLVVVQQNWLSLFSAKFTQRNLPLKRRSDAVQYLWNECAIKTKLKIGI